MLKHLAAALLALAFPTLALAQSGDSSTPPKLRLGDAVTPQGYEATLAIDPKSDSFNGEIRIRFRMNRAAPVVWMNAAKLIIESAEFRQGERTVAVTIFPGGEDFLGFEAKGARFNEGETTATIRYKGALEPLTTRGLFRQREANEWYVVSQFEAYSARRAFPCFDEPGWKTPWKLTIDSPATNVVVSNTPEAALGDTPGRSGWKRHAFVQTKPLPTYLIALAVGPFDVVDGGTAGRNKTPLRYLAPKGYGAGMRYAKESTPRLLELLEDYFGSPYPFEKLDAVTIPQTVGFGAMENVGMITYAANLILARPNEETSAFKRRYAAIASHEIAHMWYGNLVTPAWWDDIWLNEAFATWMGRKIAAQYSPSWDSGWQRNFGRSRALFADRLPSTRRIHNPIVVKDDINAAFDRITYDKGGEGLSMFEAWLGYDTFRQGVRNYIREREYGTATSRDFFKALGDAAGKGDAALSAFNAFVDQPGIPLMDATLECDAAKQPALAITQRRLQPAGTNLAAMQWSTPACFSFRDSGKVMKQCAEIHNGVNRVVLEGAKACPAWAVGNAGGGGHYVVRPDAKLAARVVAGFAGMPEFEAVAIVNDASLLSRVGLMPLNDALALFRVALDHNAPTVRRSAVEGLRLVHPEHVVASIAPMKAQADEAAVALARKVGWTERPREDEETQELRVLLLPYAAQTAAGTGLRNEARELALQWVKDRGGADPMMITPILDTAARFADADAYEKLEALALSTPDLRERRQLQSALAKVRDEKLRARALTLSVEMRDSMNRMPGRDVLLYLEDALEDDANRRVAFAFVRDNFDVLRAKVPAETAAFFVSKLERLCTASDRDQFVGFFKDRAPSLIGGPRRYALSLEAVDICVAATPR